MYEAGHRFYTAQTMVSVLSELGIEEKLTLPLQSVTSPEEKRVIIGNTFMKVRSCLLPVCVWCEWWELLCRWLMR